LKEALVPECPGSSQCICGFEVPCAATGRWRWTIVVPQDVTSLWRVSVRW
jgi:hypothetical protein